MNSDYLCYLMEKRKMSVRTLAKAAGCSHSTIGHYRTRLRESCSNDEVAERIAEALDVPMVALFLPESSRAMQDAEQHIPA